MKTLNLIILLFCILVLLGCHSNEKWEYKVLTISNQGYDRDGHDALKATKASPSESDLNKLGAEGWELVASYLEIETAYPNFGDAKYVTGIQPNIRPQSAVLIFKRHFKK